jgi:hypothetical protein
MATLSGGDKVKAKLEQLAALASKSAKLRVGFLEKSRYPDGTPVAMIAAIQDSGAPRAGIPPRPFFRNMIADKKGEWPEAIAEQFREKGYDSEKALDAVGQTIAGQLKESIIKTNEPPLAPSTVARKGFSKPLIDTTQMINSVDREVVAT